jgi:hypothetical protein
MWVIPDRHIETAITSVSAPSDEGEDEGDGDAAAAD